MSSTHCSKHCTDTTTRRIFDIWRLIFYLLPPPIWNYLYLVGKSWCKSRWRFKYTDRIHSPQVCYCFDLLISWKVIVKWSQNICKLFSDKLNQLKAADQGWKADLFLVSDGQQHGNYTYKWRKAVWRRCSVHRWTRAFHVRKQCT